MHAVIVNDGLAYPPTAGNRIRTLNLMLRLAKRHRITYLCRDCGDRSALRTATEFLGDHGIQTIVVPDPLVRCRGSRLYGRLAMNLFSPLPYAVESHNSPAVRHTVHAYAARHRVDLWQFEWLSNTDATHGLPDARKIVVAHNVESLIWQRYCETESNPLKRWYLKRQWRRFERFEQWVYANATRVVAVSEHDAALLRERFGIHHVDVVDNGIDRAYFAATQARRVPGQILFLGSLDWRPNLDAVGLLLDRIFPAVRASEPAATLCLVGRHPPESLVRRVARSPGVELHADVADVRPWLASSALMAVPLRIGGGSRLKILEALACGLPVVSTEVGAEGLCLRPDRDLVVVDGVEQMADGLLRCLRDPAWANRLAASGRQRVYERYDWDALTEQLERVWESCVTSPAVLQETASR